MQDILFVISLSTQLHRNLKEKQDMFIELSTRYSVYDLMYEHGKTRYSQPIDILFLSYISDLNK